MKTISKVQTAAARLPFRGVLPNAKEPRSLSCQKACSK